MDTPEVSAAEVAGEVSKLWWIWLVLGILWIIASLIILQYDEASLTVVGMVIGILLLVAGMQQFFMAYISEKWKLLWAIFGVLFVAAGIVALVLGQGHVGDRPGHPPVPVVKGVDGDEPEMGQPGPQQSVKLSGRRGPPGQEAAHLVL